MFWIHVALSVFISIADIASLALLLFVVNFYISDTQTTGLDFLPAWLLDRSSVMLVTCVLIVFTIKNILGIIISNAQYKFTGEVAARISKQKLNTFLNGSFAEFVNADSSEFIRKIAFQPFEFCQHILAGFQQILIQAVLVFFTVAAILLYNASLFLLLLLILLPPVIIAFFFIRRRISSAKRNMHTSNEISFRYLIDALKGFVESNIYQRNEFFLKRFTDARKQFGKHLFDSLAIQAVPVRIIETFAVLGLFILMLIANWPGKSEGFELITIGAFIAAAYKIIPGIVKIINASGQINAYEVSIYDLVLDKQTTAKGEVQKSDSIYAINFDKVSFRYANQVVFNELSFHAGKGDFIGITGRSGKGKTTILNLLLGFLSPSSGVVSVNNNITSADDLRRYWSAISYVKQQTFLINDTIEKNITLKEKHINKEKLEEVIKISGVTDFLGHAEDGMEMMVTENGKNISGGQQQRIAVARALYKDAELVLLDEPFNELDETSTGLLVQHFKKLSNEGKIIIMITHDNKNISSCNKIVCLDD